MTRMKRKKSKPDPEPTEAQKRQAVRMATFRAFHHFTVPQSRRVPEFLLFVNENEFLIRTYNVTREGLEEFAFPTDVLIDALRERGLIR